jgi:hypothetical protein
MFLNIPKNALCGFPCCLTSRYFLETCNVLCKYLRPLSSSSYRCRLVNLVDTDPMRTVIARFMFLFSTLFLIFLETFFPPKWLHRVRSRMMGAPVIHLHVNLNSSFYYWNILLIYWFFLFCPHKAIFSYEYVYPHNISVNVRVYTFVHIYIVHLTYTTNDDIYV